MGYLNLMAPQVVVSLPRKLGAITRFLRIILDDVFGIELVVVEVVIPEVSGEDLGDEQHRQNHRSGVNALHLITSSVYLPLI